MSSDQEVLEDAVRYLREEVAPRAQEIDHEPDALRRALAGLCERGLMALRRPEKYGGPGVSEGTFRQFQQEVARVSGALAFLQTQHQGAVGMIASSENAALKDEYLPHMADGGRLVGVGFSQLRRAGPPVMRAEEVEGGYLLDGHVPWVTGWSLYPEFLVGASLPDGRAVFAVVPLDPLSRVVVTGEGGRGEGFGSPSLERDGVGGDAAQTLTPNPLSRDEPHGRGGSIVVSPPMRLAAMEAAQTVTVDFARFFVPDDGVAFIRPAGWIRNNDMINIALQGHFALGCARAGLDVLAQAAEKRGLGFLCEAHEALQGELDALQAATAEAEARREELATEERLRVRASQIELAVRCAHAAVAASSGAANSVDHPAQRIYREALVYTVSAQTAEIMEATLRRLTHG